SLRPSPPPTPSFTHLPLHMLPTHPPPPIYPLSLHDALPIFGPDDRLQHRFLESCGFIDSFPHHLCPSSEGFVRLIDAGMGWGLVPALQIGAELAAGRLQEILPGRYVEVPLYWHYWRNGGRLLAALTRQLAAKGLA